MPTNVCLLFSELAPFAEQATLKRVEIDGITQISLYVEGVGADKSGLQKIWDGATGHGIDNRIREGYEFLARYWEEGDEIFLFGFSRGAYTARSVAGLIRNSGLPRHPRRLSERDWATLYTLYRDRDKEPDSDPAKAIMRECNTKAVKEIACVGVWETVGELGIPFASASPFQFLNRRLQFHDVRLSSSVKHAYHALGIDEKRKNFAPTLWGQQKKEASQSQVLEQTWFAGVHTDIGGGQNDYHLSALAYEWMKVRVQKLGLFFDPTYAAKPENGDYFRPNPLGFIDDSYVGIYTALRPYLRPVCMQKITDYQSPGHPQLPTLELLHSSVLTRQLEYHEPYRPQNLLDALAQEPPISS